MSALNLLLLKPILRVETERRRGGVGREKRLQRENSQCFMLDRQKRKRDREREERREENKTRKNKARLTVKKLGQYQTINKMPSRADYKRHFTR